MPACSSDRLSRAFPSSSSLSRSTSVSPTLPSSPLSNSPPQSFCPLSNIKDSISELSSDSRFSPWSESLSSSNNNCPTILSKRLQQINHHEKKFPRYDKGNSPRESISNFPSTYFTQEKNKFLPSRILIWYLNFLLKILSRIWYGIIFLIRAPLVWTSAWICLVIVILQLPLTLLKYFLALIHTPPSELSRNKRCVLISGGSTVQAVHLARNFYKAGARVIVCEVEGLFSLARFSIACSKFYTIPRPSPGNAAEYVKALKTIVEKEKAVYYIPVSSTNPAYYDALAKPHLEIIGCECFVPGAADVTALDDPLELLRRCRQLELPTPVHFILRSTNDVTSLYETGSLITGRHFMLAAGPAGMRDCSKIQLPPNAQEFQNLRHEISEKKPWVIIRDPGGSHFITCTTIKDSRVVANVTCRVDENRGLIPEINNNITKWLEEFFSHSFGAKINGHLSFRFVQERNNDNIVTIGCRIGVGLPYVCLTSVHPRLVWRPCRHFSRQNSGPLVVGDAFRINDAFPSAIEQAKNHNSSIIGSAINKRDELFVYWDPLPYCAYYHIQLPFNRLAGAIRIQQNQHTPPLAVVQ